MVLLGNVVPWKGFTIFRSLSSMVAFILFLALYRYTLSLFLFWKVLLPFSSSEKKKKRELLHIIQLRIVHKNLSITNLFSVFKWFIFIQNFFWTWVSVIFFSTSEREGGVYIQIIMGCLEVSNICPYKRKWKNSTNWAISQ